MTTPMVFHLPNALDPNWPSGSQLRPLAMLEAFKQAGYDPLVVMGNGRERQLQVTEVERRLAAGERFSFAYSESSTMPTLLTEPDHLPRYPTLDFGLFKALRRAGIPVGLFYRDIYWRFPQYRETVRLWKRLVAVPLYRYDLYQYRRLVDVLFLPSRDMGKLLRSPVLEPRVVPLPPGCRLPEKTTTPAALAPGEKLRLLYVGGVTPPTYDLRPLLEGIKGASATLTIACRVKDWEENRGLYGDLGPNVTVVHVDGQRLVPLYDAAHAAMIVRSPDPYLDFAMPVKLFEAIGFAKPLIASAGNAVGRFVDEERVGWCVNSPSELRLLLDRLASAPSELGAMASRLVQVRERHTWAARVRTVVTSLSAPSLTGKAS